ncbi:hypothetical protein [Roseibacillus ishigakijimensis]|uniref:Transposase n=1 Tax=Roseibacillus ishigakijimensis TaxID=454146 RepID=A0A934RWG0_9BACT|nr:hypothetical protein [Roseibacillus ishigakijimensis]MBK1835686.1 hypothetical protein [Roseibacillus ishigakijimensis]
MKTEVIKGPKRHTEEFKAPALELYAAGKPVAEVAVDLCIRKGKRDDIQQDFGHSICRICGGCPTGR